MRSHAGAATARFAAFDSTWPEDAVVELDGLDQAFESRERFLGRGGTHVSEAYERAICASRSRAVKAFDHARSKQSGNNADESLQAFEGLVAGRWSIVQSFESDGRRYLIAIQNQPGQVAASAVSPNQAHALLLRAQGLAYKVVSYELGLSEGKTHHLVQQGMSKLGIARETDLPLLFRQQAAAELEKARGDG